ncbi:MAG: UDP-N-acetylglucosamine 2-epimerase (non-hydrolyzing) [Chloroflexi bacterium]|nr:UDP-N-acetylglucosamine 2-epimerase (non-hydrolyzing) [Chloroflexota bacterium]
MRILHVVGARPNFMKIAPLIWAMDAAPEQFSQTLVHTGQHYDDNMSQVFFDDLELPRPAVNLGVGAGSHAWQTAQVMLRLEPVVLDSRPDWVVVVGDVNSTLAAALVCGKLGRRVAHVEAGLRSFDRTMPEEINRVLTDQVSDLLFTPDRGASENLVREGIAPERIHFVGNVMIDTLKRLLPRTDDRPIMRALGLTSDGAPAAVGRYVLVTLHRPSNVDSLDALTEIVYTLTEIARSVTVIFPAHPRTQKQIARLGLVPRDSPVRLVDPLGYLDFLSLLRRASLVLTDSGGVQEETTYLGVPCLTLRPNTERPVTISQGTNRLVSGSREALARAVSQSLGNGDPKYTTRRIPELWDGAAAERIVQIIAAQPP